MEPRHRYEYDVDVDGDSAAANVIRMVGTAKQVLEIGAGPGSIARPLVTLGGCRVSAIEIDPAAIPKLEPYCENVYEWDLNDPAWPALVSAAEMFDVVVAADVLEHLYDPLATLMGMQSVLEPEGYLVLSLPHAGHSAVVAALAAEDFNYRDWGLLDRTHVRFFGMKNIEELLYDAGLAAVEVAFVVVPPEKTELAEQWKDTRFLLKRTLRKNPFGSVYQVVIKAKPNRGGTSGIRVSDTTALSGQPQLSPRVRVKGLAIDLARDALGSHLNERNRRRLRRLADRAGLK